MFAIFKKDPILMIVFLLIGGIYLNIINIPISYQVQPYAFYTDYISITNILKSPSGLAEGLANAIGQFLGYRLWSIIMLTLLSVITFYFSRKIFSLFNLKSSLTLGFSMLVTVTIFAPLKDYSFPLFYIIQFILAIIFVYLYFIIKTRTLLLSFLKFLFLAVMLVHVAGGIALIYLGVIIILSEYLQSDNKKLVFSFIVAFSIVSILHIAANYIYYFTFKQIILGKDFLTYNYGNFKYYLILYSILPISLIILKILNNKPISENKLLFSTLAIIISATIIIIFPYDKNINNQYKVRYYARSGQWEEILKLAGDLQSNDRIINFYTNQALFFTDKYTTDLFKYPQEWGEYALHLGYFTERSTLMDNSDLFYHLGHIGAAKYWALEAHINAENDPYILQRLTELFIIMGNYKAALRFARKLSTSLLHKDIAAYYIQCINDSSTLQSDYNLMLKKRQMLKNNFFINKKDPVAELSLLLKEDSTNQMAVKYLLAYYLMKLELTPFIKTLEKYYSKNNYLPAIYEQAILAYLTKYSLEKNWPLRKETIERFKSYIGIINYYNGNLEVAKESLRNSFGDTYWYYMQFVCPIITKKEIKIEYE